MFNQSRVNNDSYTKLRNGSQHALRMLTAEFLLGMAVNLIGFPSEATGSAKVATIIFLGLHILIAVGLLVGAVHAIQAARELGNKLRHLTFMAAASIVITFAAGVLTINTESSWWSYLMAAGFIAALLSYVAVFVEAKPS